MTFHDAFPYFAAALRVRARRRHPAQRRPGADARPTWPRSSNRSRPRACKAVFSEAQFNPELAKTLAHEAGITKVVTTLYNDTVGPPPNDTYLSMMRWNMDQIVEALRE